jgi:cyclomaltodextrinase / maltogenic alpha-amylase / neopullulanase
VKRPLFTAAGALMLLAGAAQAAGDAAACRSDPLQGRSVYLRGSFNGWATPEAQRFTWLCNRWELVTRLQGEHAFKLADEGWSADADYGSADGTRLVRKGPEIKRRFAGTYRFTVTMADPNAPQLTIAECPVGEGGPPLGATALFLRGSMNNWAALDDFSFLYSCDAYYLNVKLSGTHEFKIADAGWKDASTVGSSGLAGQNSANFKHTFDGEHTLRLAWAGGRPVLDIGPKTFADPRAAAVSDPVALSLRFDSRNAAHKQPFGAVKAGTPVDFALTSAPGVGRVTLVVERRRLEGNQEVLAYTELARVPMQRASEGGTDRWTARHTFSDVAVYGYWFEAQIGERLFAFQNNTDAVYWTREKGSGGLGSVGERPANPGPIRRFRQTVYAADFTVPDWAPDVVYYYIFPERFRNGDKRNDPKPGRDRYQNHGIEKHRKWLDKPWKPGTGDGSDTVFNNDFFGGDLQGIIAKLDYIRRLGANTIYMTPVFRAPSNHKYDTADYRQVDPAFGSNDDFTRLTREAAKRGIRVILDASLNHTGSDSIYFDRYGHFGGQGAFAGGKPNPASPYFNWYTFDLAQPEPDKQFRGWVGVTDLPELDKASPAWRDFAYRAPDSVTRLWLQRGASGWRMDVAPWVSDDFWREWRAAVKQTRPDALTVAEAWFDSSKYFLGDMFDSTMNYIFRNAVQDYAAGGNAARLYEQLEHLREAYPPQAHRALMNLLSSHDQARALHVFGWHDDTRDAAVITRAKQRLKLAVLFQMIYPGAPSIYYGDEVGVTGGDDPYNRATYPWADEGGEPDTALLAEFKRLTRMRHANPVLRRGSLEAPLFADAHVIVLARRLGDTWAITATNNAEVPRTVTLPLPQGLKPGVLKDALSGAAVKATAQGLTFEVPALFGRVLIRR